MPLTLSSYCNRSRDVLGTVSMTMPFNRSKLGPLLPSETVDKLELDCLNSVRVRADHPPLNPRPPFIWCAPRLPTGLRKGCTYGPSCPPKGRDITPTSVANQCAPSQGQLGGFPVYDGHHTMEARQQAI